jgi:alpha-galactosidase
MYYAFFAPAGAANWIGTVELRGLAAGKYRVTDYENGRDLGTIDTAHPQLAAQFHEHLLLEAAKE